MLDQIFTEYHKTFLRIKSSDGTFRWEYTPEIARAISNFENEEIGAVFEDIIVAVFSDLFLQCSVMISNKHTDFETLEKVCRSIEDYLEGLLPRSGALGYTEIPFTQDYREVKSPKIGNLSWKPDKRSLQGINTTNRSVLLDYQIRLFKACSLFSFILSKVLTEPSPNRLHTGTVIWSEFGALLFMLNPEHSDATNQTHEEEIDWQEIFDKIS